MTCSLCYLGDERGTLNRSLQNRQLLPTQDGNAAEEEVTCLYPPLTPGYQKRRPGDPPFRSTTAPSRVLLTVKCQKADVDISSSKESYLFWAPRPL